MKRLIAAMAALMLMMSGVPVFSEKAEESVKELFSDRDLAQDYKAEKAVPVDLSAGSDAEGASFSGGTLTISAEGIYVLTGTMNGQLRITAPEDAKVQMVLSNAHITSSSAAAVVV